MFKTASRLLMTAAAASLAFAPIAAQANTRAGDNSRVYTSDSSAQPGLERDAEGEGLVGLPGLLAAILGVAAVAITVVIVEEIDDDDGDGDASPGT
jgi:hypothetical protein